MPNYKQLGKATGQLGKVAGYVMKYGDKQSLQTKYRKFKYKAGRRIRKALGVKEPPIRKPSEYKINK